MILAVTKKTRIVNVCAGNAQHEMVIRSSSVLCNTCTHFGACNGNSEMLNLFVKHCLESSYIDIFKL